MKILEVSGLSANYNERKIVKNISFSIEKGEFCALLGANGCGKTTLVRSICGLMDSDGMVTIGGNYIKKLGEKSKAKLISYIPQKSSVGLAISALDVVLMGFSQALGLFQNHSREMVGQAELALEQVGMADLANRNFLTLSEGEKQLVIIARALVQSTEILLFDEPESALDFANKHRVIAMIKSLVAGEKAALICLHDANIALRYCTRLLLMREGEILHDIDLSSVSHEKLQSALSDIYGDIELINHSGNYIMLKR